MYIRLERKSVGRVVQSALGGKSFGFNERVVGTRELKVQREVNNAWRNGETQGSLHLT